MGWIVWRHRENLARLKAGTENRFEKNRNPKINYHHVMNEIPTIKVGILDSERSVRELGSNLHEKFELLGEDPWSSINCNPSIGEKP